jgi:hypothetical protein
VPALSPARGRRTVGAARSGARRVGAILKLSKECYVAAYDISLIYAALGETDDTFLWLDRAVEDRSTLMVFLAQDPMLDAFHADPRFAPLVERIGVYRRK